MDLSGIFGVKNDNCVLGFWQKSFLFFLDFWGERLFLWAFWGKMRKKLEKIEFWRKTLRERLFFGVKNSLVKGYCFGVLRL